MGILTYLIICSAIFWFLAGLMALLKVCLHHLR